MCCLDLSRESPLHELLLMDGLQELRTVQEADFGEWLGDVNYFGELRHRRPSERLFICTPRG